jgi:hypothetical protein
MPATKPARTMTVTNPAGTTYVTVNEGKRSDTYRVLPGYACVIWSHVGDPARGGNVRVNGAGRAVDCDCRATLYGRSTCRHRSGTEALIRRGVVVPGVVSESNDAMADQPESHLYSTETE